MEHRQPEATSATYATEKSMQKTWEMPELKIVDISEATLNNVNSGDDGMGPGTAS